jgi:hypothetical protein
MTVYNGVLYPADPPEGVERDPDQKPEAGILIIITGITFTLSTISIITRLYGRIVLIKSFAFDDCQYTQAWEPIDKADSTLQSSCCSLTYATLSW